LISSRAHCGELVSQQYSLGVSALQRRSPCGDDRQIAAHLDAARDEGRVGRSGSRGQNVERPGRFQGIRQIIRIQSEPQRGRCHCQKQRLPHAYTGLGDQQAQGVEHPVVRHAGVCQGLDGCPMVVSCQDSCCRSRIVAPGRGAHDGVITHIQILRPDHPVERRPVAVPQALAEDLLGGESVGDELLQPFRQFRRLLPGRGRKTACGWIVPDLTGRGAGCREKDSDEKTSKNTELTVWRCHVPIEPFLMCCGGDSSSAGVPCIPDRRMLSFSDQG